jgi:hypothetical protein
VKYQDMDAIARQLGSIVFLQVNQKRLAFELPSEEDASAVVEDLHRRAAMPAPDRDENVAALLARGERSTSEWLAAVRKQASPSEGSRNLHLAEDRLWAVLEDPSADPTARVAAAVALRTQSGGRRAPELDQRVRVAASSTAFPQIRIALEEVVDAPDDEQVVARVMRVLS